MKKTVALTLSAVLLFSLFLLFPRVSKAAVSADECWNNWERCRTRALESDLGTIRTTLALTVCDIALGKCLINSN
ncbi:MAG: hypothetical protein ACPLRX_06850 [Candidatus Saccharicenans sp.]